MIRGTHSTAPGQSLRSTVLLSTTPSEAAQVHRSTGLCYTHIQVSFRPKVSPMLTPENCFSCVIVFLFFWNTDLLPKPNHIGSTPREATLEDERAAWGRQSTCGTLLIPEWPCPLVRWNSQHHVTMCWNIHPILLLDKHKIAHAPCQFMFPQHKRYSSNSPNYVRAGLRHRFGIFIYLFYRTKSPRDYPKSTWISWVEKLKWILYISKQTCTNILAVSSPMALHQRRGLSYFTSGVE